MIDDQEFCKEVDVFDLHIESLSFYRTIGYHPARRHRPGPLRRFLFGHADLPRLKDVGFSGATWSLTANPFRRSASRERRSKELFREVKRVLTLNPEASCQVVSDHASYQEAKAQGKHGAFLGIQGANFLPSELEKYSDFAHDLLRVTLVHMNQNSLAQSSAPHWHATQGLSQLGRETIATLNQLRIGVDLAHMNEAGFWDAVDEQKPGIPFMVSHTGMNAVHPHWRNIDDEQARAVAQSGGVIGIIYHSLYLGDGLWRGKLDTLLAHIRHAVQVCGIDHVGLGSDWDGLICTPMDMPTCSEFPRLAGRLRKEFGDTNARKILGENALRMIRDLKGR
ncbi:MAG: dipeptidase [Polyangiaceae bacterium]|nr:dipeptidase [Polyangiaceae bacterium]